MGETSTKVENLGAAMVKMETRPDQARRVEAKEIAMIRSVPHIVYRQL